MKKQPEELALLEATEKIRLRKPVGRIGLLIFAFLICVSILIAAFAVSQVWKRGKKNVSEESAAPQTTEPSQEKSTVPPDPLQPSLEEPIVLQNATAILSKTYPDAGIQNETNSNLPEGSMTAGLFRDVLKKGNENPVVLILHTHPREAYLKGEADCIQNPIGSSTYSADPARNVAAVGEVLCRTLCERGIPAVHAVEESPQESSLGAYTHSAEVISAWRTKYPSILLVIDVQRDAILDPEGNYIRPVAEIKDAGKAAQIKAIVGSNADGSDYPDWEQNCKLALALREELNRSGTVLMRSVAVRRSSYHQEFSPYALLLDVGSGANTVEEACRAAEQIGLALAALLI